MAGLLYESVRSSEGLRVAARSRAAETPLCRARAGAAGQPQSSDCWRKSRRCRTAGGSRGTRSARRLPLLRSITGHARVLWPIIPAPERWRHT